MFANTITFLLATSAALLGAAAALPTAEADKALSPRADGKFTWYYPGLGACGQWNSENQLVAALNAADFDPYTPNGNPNRNSLCGRRIRANYNGKSVEVTVVDRCPGCPRGGLDLSPAAFQRLAHLNAGVIYGNWQWI
ncbi:hypothetical protein VTJ04DRAFT_5808 [Mycothermus thermophilus]|uniref:uncharacterized protein n=1 Tax=Humicola insolens TaxID=85995 RepID=UPI0037435226